MVGDLARRSGRWRPRTAILVNNAGIVAPGDGPPAASSLDAIERALRVNFIRSVAVTQAMFPLLRKAPSARIVNVSSGLGSITQNGDPAHPDAAAKFLGYSASKAALSFEKLDKHVVVGCGRASPRFQGGAYTTK